MSHVHVDRLPRPWTPVRTARTEPSTRERAPNAFLPSHCLQLESPFDPQVEPHKSRLHGQTPLGSHHHCAPLRARRLCHQIPAAPSSLRVPSHSQHLRLHHPLQQKTGRSSLRQLDLATSHCTTVLHPEEVSGTPPRASSGPCLRQTPQVPLHLCQPLYRNRTHRVPYVQRASTPAQPAPLLRGFSSPPCCRPCAASPRLHLHQQLRHIDHCGARSSQQSRQQSRCLRL